ncbi:MAG: sugar transferase [Alphaproteobacteria bacterium]
MLQSSVELLEHVKQGIAVGMRALKKRLQIAERDVEKFSGGDVPRDFVQLNKTSLIAKRILDVLIASAAMLLLLPLFIVLAIAIKIDGGSIFYTGVRVGKAGREFPCFKFRSMASNADRILKDYLAANPLAAAEYDRYHKLRHDPRITRIGHFLRKTSLDELPQLLNVLLGDMSLVGPRPYLPSELKKLGSCYALYKLVRPGITGLWQVSGRSNLGFMERVDLDRQYVQNWSLWQDIKILFKTLPAVLRQKGAC